MLVQQHADGESERIAAQQLVGGVVLGNAQLWHAGSVPHELAAVAAPRVQERIPLPLGTVPKRGVASRLRAPDRPTTVGARPRRQPAAPYDRT